MNIYIIKKALFIVGIPLLLSGCGEKSAVALPSPSAAPSTPTTTVSPAAPPAAPSVVAAPTVSPSVAQTINPKPVTPIKKLFRNLKNKFHFKNYIISGIGIGMDMGKTNSAAIINNQVVTPGEEIDPGVVLEEIHPSFATLTATAPDASFNQKISRTNWIASGTSVIPASSR